MIDAFFLDFLQGLSLSSEGASFLALVMATGSLAGLHKLGGLSGLYVYNALVVCLANIQILHVAHYATGPLPLGTVLFTTLFLSDTLIVHRYGAKAAQRGVALNVLAYVVFAGHMLIALMHPPAGSVPEQMADPFLQDALQNYQAMERLFTPSLRLLAASCVASVASQMGLIQVFCRIKLRSANVYLNQFVSTLAASVTDHLVFTCAAFYVLADTRPSVRLFWDGYVFRSFVLRLLIIAGFIAVDALYRCLRHPRANG